MNGLLAAIRKEVLEQWRTSRLLIAAAVLVVFGLTSPLLAKYTPELLKLAGGDEIPAGLAELIPTPVVADAVGQYLENMGQFGTILALVLGLGVVAQEKERGTAAMMLTKPLPRWAFVLAKFIGLGATFLVSLALAGAGAYYYTALLFEPLDVGRWAALNGLVLLMLLAYAAVTLFFSTLARTQATAAGLALAGLIGLGLVGALPPVARYLPGRLVSWAGALVLAPTAEPAWPALAGSLALIALALVGSWWVLERQEL